MITCVARDRIRAQHDLVDPFYVLQYFLNKKIFCFTFAGNDDEVEDSIQFLLLFVGFLPLFDRFVCSLGQPASIACISRVHMGANHSSHEGVLVSKVAINTFIWSD